MTDTAPRYSLDWLEGLNRATLTTAEAGRVLSMTERTVIRLVRGGDLEGGRIGHRYYVAIDALIRHLRT